MSTFTSFQECQMVQIKSINRLMTAVAAATLAGCGGGGEETTARVNESAGGISRTLAATGGESGLTGTADAKTPQKDLPFGTNGTATLNLVNTSESWNDVVSQPDGKIVAVGLTANLPQQNWLIARYLPSGQLDTSFNGTGFVEIDLAVDRQDNATRVVLQPDGKIVVAGSSGCCDQAMVRLNADGSIDPTFGVSGVVVTKSTVGVTSLATCVELLLLPDGSFRFIGRAINQPGWGVTAYNANGTLDQSFGIGGNIGIVRLVTQGETEPGGAVLNNGLITIGGFNLGSFVAARIDATTGAFDPSFGTGGV
ncbi:MAG: hypothetical protein H7Z19_12440, partial [Chitinophagaceae bacterium]|nr:hypothetical protein [Rubrivivax sp.]